MSPRPEQPTRTIDLDELAAQARWLRGLARSLVADDADADDLVQDTLVRAAERAPDDRPLGPSLVRAMRNLARMRWRGDRRRSARAVRVDRGGEVRALVLAAP